MRRGGAGGGGGDLDRWDEDPRERVTRREPQLREAGCRHLKEAEETDRWEDGLFGPDRGDEVPEHLRTEEGRRTAFKAAKERLAKKAGRGDEPRWCGSSLIRSGSQRRVAGVGARASGGSQGMLASPRAGRKADRGPATRLLDARHRLEEAVRFRSGQRGLRALACRAPGGRCAWTAARDPPKPYPRRRCRRV